MLNDTLAGARRRTVSALDSASRPFRRIWPRLPEALLGIVALAVVLFAILTYSPDLADRASRLVTGNRYLTFVDGMLNPFRNQHVLMKSGLPVYDLRIRSDQIRRLDRAADRAVEAGILTEEMQDWVPGTLIAEGKQYRVDVRLRGDLPNHWSGAKRSYRIKFDEELVENADGEIIRVEQPFQGRTEAEPEKHVALMAKNQINLIIPNDRDYAVAPLVGELMQEAGLVTPRWQYVVLRINGRLQGLYYEVEHFDKPLMAAYDRPETAILGQNGRAQHFEQYTRLGTGAASDANLDLASARLAVDPAAGLSLPLLAALNAHERNPSPANFRRARAALDWDKYLHFRALTTLLNTNHVRFGSDNLKLFHDPSRGLLEPVPWDVHMVRMPTEPGTIDYWNTHGPDELQRSTLLDPALRLERNKILWKWVGDGGERLMARYDAIHDRLRPLVWADVLTTPGKGYNMDQMRRDLKFNVERVHKVLGLSSANLVYRQLAPDRAGIDFATLNFSGVDLEAITLYDTTWLGNALDAGVTTAITTTAALAEAPALGAAESPTMTMKFKGLYRLVEDLDEDGMVGPGDHEVARAVARDGIVHFALGEQVLPEVAYKRDIIEDRTWEFMDTLSGRRHYLVLGDFDTPERDPLLRPFPGIGVEARNAVSGAPMRAAAVDGGEAPPVDGTVGILAYDASDPIDLDAITASREDFLAAHPVFRPHPDRPEAVELRGRVLITDTVIVPEGVPLVIQPGTDLRLAPEVNFLMYGGLTALGRPDARIRIHGDASGRPWDTFAAVRPPEPVHLRHVDVRDGGQGHINGMLFTGGLAVHNGDLVLENVRVTDMASEDGINIKNGRLEMSDSLVARTASDGIDVDFGTGFIRDSHFKDIAGDGIDFSGTTDFVVSGTRVDGTGDKCFSVGEASAPTIVNNLMKGCVRGLSTKDRSSPRVAFNTFLGNKVAIEALRKKPMFGGAGGTFVYNVFAENGALVDEDRFSEGQVKLSHALSDDPAAACPGCRVVEVLRFRDAAAGDYRLAEPGAPGEGQGDARAAVAGGALSLAAGDIPDWAIIAADGGRDASPPAPVPGIYSPPAELE